LIVSYDIQLGFGEVDQAGKIAGIFHLQIGGGVLIFAVPHVCGQHRQRLLREIRPGL
jgi:hypothetical protein